MLTLSKYVVVVFSVLTLNNINPLYALNCSDLPDSAQFLITSKLCDTIAVKQDSAYVDIVITFHNGLVKPQEPLWSGPAEQAYKKWSEEFNRWYDTVMTPWYDTVMLPWYLTSNKTNSQRVDTLSKTFDLRYIDIPSEQMSGKDSRWIFFRNDSCTINCKSKIDKISSLLQITNLDKIDLYEKPGILELTRRKTPFSTVSEVIKFEHFTLGGRKINPIFSTNMRNYSAITITREVLPNGEFIIRKVIH